jgi:penicillin-binding protein 1C
VTDQTSAPPAAGPAPAAGRRWRRARRGLAILGLALASLVAIRLLPHPTLRARVPLSTAVTAADGTLLRLTLAADGQYRLWTPLEGVSPLLVEATLLYEDRHFAWHPGVDPIALVRAAFATYLSGGRRIGGSTLTMQLARRLWSLSSHDVEGKLVQIARAIELEALYSKREILEAYLNLAPYGGNIEGVGAASQIYFRKPPSALTLAEALTLAVIPQSPTRRSRGTERESPASPMGPSPSPLDRARTGLLASFMAHARPARPAERELPIVLSWPRLRRPDDLPFAAPHFVDQILTQILAIGAAPPGRLPASATATATVTTTLDLHLQRLLERHLTAYVARERRRGIANAAALLVETRSLAVRALVGSADFFDPGISGQVNGVVARRSPGSTLKPFAYALGLDQGIIHPATMLRDVPTSFAAYSPENFDGRFVGPLSAKDALIRSRNVPALTIAARLSRPGFFDFLQTAGVDLPMPESHYGLGLVLGTGEVTMTDLVRLYAALGNGGVMRPLVWRKPDLDDDNDNDDNTHHHHQPARPGVRLLSEESAFLVLDMLADNPRPTGRLGAVAQARPLAVSWKTGTSWGFRDAWAVGLFGPYVLAIWIGDFSGAGNPAYVGVQAAAPLFFEIVDSIAAQQPALFTGTGLLPPKGVRRVEICALSGGLPTAGCPQRRMSWFIPGRSPIEPCQIHRAIALDAAGRRTCALGPRAVRTETFEVWPSDLTRLFAAAGLPRRSLPPAAPGCGEVEAARGAAPRITSPLAGVTYTLRPSRPDAGTLALQAVTDGDAAEVFWFADQAFVGRSPRGATFFWKPARPGLYTLRAVDDLGRSDARAVAVEVLR